MTQKENALRIIRFNSPERVVGGLPGQNLCYHGCNHEGFAGGGHDCPLGSRWTDIWGTGWRKEHAGVMGFPRENPLADVSALKRFPWPDPDDARICGKIHAMAAELDRGADAFVYGSHRDTLWEKAYMLVGMENMMMYFYTEPEFAREVLRRIMDFQLGIARHYLQEGIEVAALGDDMGTQTGPLLGPAIMNEFLVPEYRRLFNLYKKNNVLIEFHSCGNIEAALPIFMDLGVDVVNPVQATANNLERLREIGGQRITFKGGISTGLIMDGPVERIRSAVRETIALLGRNGGYFCGPDQGMPFPPEHHAALNEAVEEYGRY